MTGISIGGRWGEAGAFKSLRVEHFMPGEEHFGALARVINETQGTNWPRERVEAFYGSPSFEPERDARLVFLGDRPVAAGICYPAIYFHDRRPGNFEIFVVPDAAGHGIGSRLLAHLELAARGRGHLALETTLDPLQQERYRGFLLRHGFRPVGQAAHLARDNMDDLPAEALPEGFKLYDLEQLGGDAELYRETCNRLGAHDQGYQLIQPEEMAQTLSTSAWDPRGVLFLLDPEQRIAGVIRAGRADGDTGYLFEIRLEPSYRGQRLAISMVGAALRYLAAMGVEEVELDTESVGTPPYRLAQRAGFRETHRWVRYIKSLAE